MAEKSFDVVVIGSGPGGYVAAIRSAQLGLKTAIIEKSKHLGGTCLNVGCIPSKSLLHSTEIYHTIHSAGEEMGIESKGLSFNVQKMMAKKEQTVNQLRAGIVSLIKANKIERFEGTGSLRSSTEVAVNGETALTAKNIILATGSVPIELGFMRFDGKTIVSSDHAIAFDAVPKKMVVVGAGAIGLELGSVWARLGTDVTIVELLPRIAITFDQEISKTAERLFKKQGMKFELEAKVSGVQTKKGKTFLIAEKNGNTLEFEADKVVVCVGRKAYTEGLGLEKVGLTLDERGRIPTNQHCQTKIPNIYAIGDVTDGPMLAHKAEDEGIAAAEKIAGKAGHVNYDCVPNVIYTSPEIASVGISEQEAKDRGIAVNIGKFPFAANGRALASGVTEGLAKVIACAKTDKLLGVQILGHNASELISAAVTHMEYGGSAEDMARTFTAHPTMAEALKEAAMASSKWSIHQG